MNISLTKVKVGDRTQRIVFKLGKLNVASIFCHLTYGLQYVPKFHQTHEEVAVLNYFDNYYYHRFLTVDEAILKLKEICGEENFNLLTRYDGEIYDDIEELDIIPPAL